MLPNYLTAVRISTHAETQSNANNRNSVKLLRICGTRPQYEKKKTTKFLTTLLKLIPPDSLGESNRWKLKENNDFSTGIKICTKKHA